MKRSARAIDLARRPSSVPQDESSNPVKLVEVPETAFDAGLQSPSPETPGRSAATATPEQKGITLKGMLMMAVCCGAPILLLAAVGLFGVAVSFGENENSSSASPPGDVHHRP
jgi:hypothetical protein